MDDSYMVVVADSPFRAVTPTPTGHGSRSPAAPPVSAAANNTTTSPSNQERDFDAEIEELFAGIDSD